MFFSTKTRMKAFQLCYTGKTEKAFQLYYSEKAEKAFQLYDVPPKMV